MSRHQLRELGSILDYESVALYYVNAAERCIHALCPTSVHHYKVTIYLSAPSNSEIK